MKFIQCQNNVYVNLKFVEMVRIVENDNIYNFELHTRESNYFTNDACETKDMALYQLKRMLDE
jgi:hypothetical protein